MVEKLLLVHSRCNDDAFAGSSIKGYSVKDMRLVEAKDPFVRYYLIVSNRNIFYINGIGFNYCLR